MKNDEWREKYLIGITEIDDDHQHLFDVIAMEVSELILNKDKVQTYFSTKNIDDLLTKIKQHYHNEELWMKGHQYPHIEKHQEQHSNSVEEIEKVAALIENRDFSNWISFYLTALENLDGHVLEYDKKIGEYYQELGFQ